MTSRGRFQPQPFCDFVIIYSECVVYAMNVWCEEHSHWTTDVKKKGRKKKKVPMVTIVMEYVLQLQMF